MKLCIFPMQPNQLRIKLVNLLTQLALINMFKRLPDLYQGLLTKLKVLSPNLLQIPHPSLNKNEPNDNLLHLHSSKCHQRIVLAHVRIQHPRLVRSLLLRLLQLNHQQHRHRLHRQQLPRLRQLLLSHPRPHRQVRLPKSIKNPIEVVWTF